MRAYRTSVSISCCLAALAMSQPSELQAQSASDEEEAEPKNNSIIVTGERLPRTLKETASSVFVVRGEDVDTRAGGDDVADFLELIPNVQVVGNQNNGPTIRGQNSTGVLSGINAFFGGSRQRSTILVDGRPLSFNEFIFGQTGVWDIERVEVFLGPQTTAQGPDSIAGAIYVETADPTFESEFAVRAQGGNFDTYHLSGMVNVPVVSDELAIRAALDYRAHQSFVDFTFPEEAIGADRSDDDYITGRVKLRWVPEALAGFTAQFTYNYTETNGPQSENVQPLFEDRTRSVPGVSVFDTQTHSVIAELSYEVAQGFTLSNRFTYADAQIERFAPAGTGDSQIERDEITNEFLLTYAPTTGHVQGVAGVYVQEFDADEAINLAAFGLGDGAFTDEVSSLGLFGEVTVSPTERLHLTGGLRYQEATQGRDGGFAVLPPVDFDETFSAWLPKGGIAYDVTDQVRIGFEARRGFNPGGVTLSFFTGQLDTFDQETLWNYEFYARANGIDDRLDLAINVFYTDFDNAQRPVNVVVPGGIITEIAQAEDARSYGAEVSAQFEIAPRVRLNAALGLLKTEIRTVSLEPGIEGNEFERAPGLSASFGIDLEPIDSFTLNLQGRFTDNYFSDDANTQLSAVDGFFIADAQASYTFGGVRLFAFVTNLFDEFNTLQQFGPGTAVVNDPREWGVGATYRF